MLRYFILITVVFSFITAKSQCNDQLVGDASKKIGDFYYVKDFKIKFKKAKKNKEKKVLHSLILNRNTTYLFILGDAKEYGGRIMFEMFGDKGKLLSNYNKKSMRYYDKLQFICESTDMYQITLSFSEGQEGCGVLVFASKQSYQR
jgi:hypothetical protein